MFNVPAHLSVFEAMCDGQETRLLAWQALRWRSVARPMGRNGIFCFAFSVIGTAGNPRLHGRCYGRCPPLEHARVEYNGK